MIKRSLFTGPTLKSAWIPEILKTIAAHQPKASLTIHQDKSGGQLTPLTPNLHQFWQWIFGVKLLGDFSLAVTFRWLESHESHW